MTQILLVRHGSNDYTQTNRLAGWTPDVHLSEQGQAEAEAVAQRLKDAPITQLYASPLDRTMETAQAICRQKPNLTIQQIDGIGEVDYGDWQGEKISTLAQRKMWQVVQEYPSRAYFPNGESMRAAQVRIVNALEELARRHPRETVAVVSHADLIKMALAHYLGMHLDNFQRIVVSTASISVLILGFGRPYVVTMNDMAHLAALERERHEKKAKSDSQDAAN